MADFDMPASGAVSDDSGPSRGWLRWFRIVTDSCNAMRQSGATANRPTANLWAGRSYFDTSLGYPVWYSGTSTTWVRYDGTAA